MGLKLLEPTKMPDPLGYQSRQRLLGENTGVEFIVRQRTLHRVLAFIGRSIDDVVNDPITKNKVRGYFKLSKQIERSSEVTELERQWNNIK
jgi:hypothetical protein